MKTIKTPIREIEVTPGLFEYSGLGMGTLHVEDGKEEWMSFDKAYPRCQELGLKYQYVDKLEGFQFVYLGD